MMLVVTPPLIKVKTITSPQHQQDMMVVGQHMNQPPAQQEKGT
jgi:hypothetical protein